MNECGVFDAIMKLVMYATRALPGKRREVKRAKTAGVIHFSTSFRIVVPSYNYSISSLLLQSTSSPQYQFSIAEEIVIRSTQRFRPLFLLHISPRIISFEKHNCGFAVASVLKEPISLETSQFILRN
jgi:hypothetical protein